MDTAIGRTLVSAWSWLVLGVLVVLWLPMVAAIRLVTAPFDPGRYHAGLWFRKLAVFHQKLTPLWTFRAVGPVPTDPRRPYVVVSNHESFVDILLIANLPMEMKWLSKSDFFRYPIVGWLMRLAGDIRLERGDRDSGIAAIEECHDRLAKRVSVMIFPEGTRSKTGELQPFKDGAFRLAIDAGVPILPLVVHGTRSALRKHDWRLGRATAEVRVLDPIDTTGMTPDDVPELRERTRQAIADELAAVAATPVD